MAAATGRVYGPKPHGGEAALPHKFRYPLAASVAPKRNWLMGLNSAGYAVAMGADVVGLVSLGFSDDDQTAGTADGDSDFIGRQQFVSGFANSDETGDDIGAADVAIPCWAVDNQTVGKKSNHDGVNRSLLGLAFGLDADNNDTPIVLPGPIGWRLGIAAHMADNKVGASHDIVDSAASDAVAERAMTREPLHGTVTAIEFVGATATEDASNFGTIIVRKRDGAGGAAVELGRYSTDDAEEGTISAFEPAAFTLSVVAGALDLLETDIVTIETTKDGTGVVLDGNVRVVQKVS